MGCGEIIISIILFLSGVSIEGIFGQVILENSAGNPFYLGIWIGVKLIIIIGFLGLVDGILKKFDSSLKELIEKIVKKINDLINK